MHLRLLNKKLLISLFVIVVSVSMAITSFAYSSDWYITMSDGSTKSATGNSTFTNFVGTASPTEINFSISNSDPNIFTGNNIYTFDVSIYLHYPDASYYGSSSLMASCVNSLINSGFSTEWYAHYIFDATNITVYYADGSGDNHQFTLADGSTESQQQFYVSSDECAVSYNGTMYHGSQNDLLHFYNNGLEIQQKIHFNFCVPDTIQSLDLYWNLYNFGSHNYSTGHTYFDFGVSDMTVVDNALNQVQVNLLNSIQAVSAQVSALQSTADVILEQTQYYYEFLTADWDQALSMSPGYNVDGILPQMYLFIYDIESDIYEIALDTTQIRSSTSNIKTNTQLIKGLLDTRTNNFWKFLDADFNMLHDDLIDTNNYLNQICDNFGMNDTSTQQSITTVSESLDSSETSLITNTSQIVSVDGSTYTTVTNFIEDFNFMSGDTLNTAWDVFNRSFNLMNFAVGGVGVLTLFIFYKLITKLWGQLFFDE